jgi:hypothetical protein
VLLVASVFTRSLFDSFVGMIALILAVGFSALAAVIIRTPKTGIKT